MKPNVYKSEYNYAETIKRIEKKGYEIFGTKKRTKETNILVKYYLQTKDKTKPFWLLEISKIFDKKLEDKSSENYNGIMVINTRKSVYLVPHGHSYKFVESISDIDFGLDFAERVLTQDSVDLKSINYIQRNRTRSIINYKSGKNDINQASETINFIGGVPLHENIYGNFIQCGYGINFDKNFDIIKDWNTFLNLFNEIDKTVTSIDIVSNIPRLKKIKKDSKLSEDLSKRLLNDIISQEDIFEKLDIIRITNEGNNISLIESEMFIEIYIKGDSEKKERIELSTINVINYIRNNKDKIKHINDIKFVTEVDGNKKIYLLQEIFYCEVSYDNQLYIFQRNRWGKLNQPFLDLIDEKLDLINNEIEFNDKFSQSYPISETIKGEHAYIEALSREDNFIKLHTRNIHLSGQPVEIADIYDRNLDTLYVIKMGTETSKAMYSFDQSILAMHLLNNIDEQKIQSTLLDYNGKDNHSVITEEDAFKIINCKNISVLWLVNVSPSYVYQGVTNKTFEIKSFRSLHLKLKIIDWYMFTKEHEFSSKLLFSVNLPINDEITNS